MQQRLALLILPSTILLTFISFFSIFPSFNGSEFALAHEDKIEDAEKVLIKLESPEKLPKEIKLSKVDASVFFVNATADSPITIEVNFGSLKAHCATSNLKWIADKKKIISSEPIAPKNFAGLCFPDSGSFEVSIYGLGKDGAASKTSVIAP